MIGWILAGVAILLLGALFARIRRYGRLLSDAHFLAVGQAAPLLKQAALSKVMASGDDAPRDASDPRILKTDVGLVLVYTVSREDAEFVHHCSASVPGDHVAHGTLEFFLSFVLLSLGLPATKARFSLAAGHVHHAELKLSEAEQAALLALPPLDTSAQNLFALRSQAVDARPRGG